MFFFQLISVDTVIRSFILYFHILVYNILWILLYTYIIRFWRTSYASARLLCIYSNVCWCLHGTHTQYIFSLWVNKSASGPSIWQMTLCQYIYIYAHILLFPRVAYECRQSYVVCLCTRLSTYMCARLFFFFTYYMQWCIQENVDIILYFDSWKYYYTDWSEYFLLYEKRKKNNKDDGNIAFKTL